MAWLIAAFEPHWGWLMLGVILATAEVLLPGIFLIWLALAAIITGLITLVVPLPLAMQLVLFAMLALASVYVGRRWLRNNPISSDDPLLNDRGGRMIGEVVTVIEAIDAGTGRVKVGDGVWSARGPKTEVGSKVRICGADGNILLIEPL
jgi:inner membrane protein